MASNEILLSQVGFDTSFESLGGFTVWFCLNLFSIPLDLENHIFNGYCCRRRKGLWALCLVSKGTLLSYPTRHDSSQASSKLFTKDFHDHPYELRVCSSSISRVWDRSQVGKARSSQVPYNIQRTNFESRGTFLSCPSVRENSTPDFVGLDQKDNPDCLPVTGASSAWRIDGTLNMGLVAFMGGTGKGFSGGCLQGSKLECGKRIYLLITSCCRLSWGGSRNTENVYPYLP